MTGRLILYMLAFFVSDALVASIDTDSLYKISERQFNDGKYVEALNTNIEALKLAERLGNCMAISYGHLKVGNMHYYLRDKRMALKSYFLSGRYMDSCRIDSLRPNLYNNIGAIYTELKMQDSALIYLNKTIVLLEPTKKYVELSRINAIAAGLYIEKGADLLKANEYLLASEKYAQLSGDEKQIAFCKTKRGDLYRKKKTFVKALGLYKEALATYEALFYTEGRLHMLKFIGETLAALRDPEAQTYYTKLFVLKDSIFKIETAGKIAEYETLYKTEKKENENKALQVENSLKQSQIESRNKTIAGLLIGALLITIFLMWRISVANLKKKKQELETAKTLQKEKERISRDLHDNVGGQLSYVLYSLDGIMEEDQVKRAELSANINNSVRSVIGNLRETIWAINDEQINVNDLSDKLKVYAKNLFRNSGTIVSFNEAILQDRNLSSTIGLNLYRISQEVMNNCFKYAGASTLTVNITSDNKELKLVINDDGVGFDAGNVNNGYGLKNMKARANESGIKLKFRSAPGKGTVYTLIV